MLSTRKIYAMLPALALAFGLAGSAQAAVIGSWGFESFAADDTVGPYINEASPVAGVSVGNMVPASLAHSNTKVRDSGENRLYGASANGAGDGLPFSDKIFDLRLASDSSSAAAQVAGDGYFTFTVTATGADQVNLTQLSIFAGANKTGLGHDSTLQVDVDTDGDTVFDDTYSFANLNKVSSNNPGDQVDLVLSSIIHAGDTGTIRVLAYNDTAGNPLSTGKLRFDDLEVTADLVPDVPDADFTFRVNTDTGATSFVNPTGADVTFDYYEITSPTASLDETNWLSLDEQKFDAVDDLGGVDAGTVAGDSPLERWGKTGGSNDSLLSEIFLLDSSTLSAGQVVGLGDAFDTTGTGDLVFQYDDGSGVLQDGAVEYITNVLGDMDGDGDVDVDDVDPFVLALTNRAAYDAAYPWVDADAVGDFNSNSKLDMGDISAFAAAASPGAASATAVPEPSSLLLVAFGALALLVRRR